MKKYISSLTTYLNGPISALPLTVEIAVLRYLQADESRTHYGFAHRLFHLSCVRFCKAKALLQISRFAFQKRWLSETLRPDGYGIFCSDEVE